MLYNASLLEQSYVNNEIIAKKLNKYFEKDIIKVNENENYKEDAKIYRIEDNNIVAIETVEMKQRQNYYIRDVIDGKQKMYDYITIYKSSVDNKKDIYIIYDKSMDCCMFYRFEFIDQDDLVERWTKTEKGLFKLKMYKIKKEYITIVDLNNGKTYYF